MVPFLIPDKKIFDKTVDIKDSSAKVKKRANKNTASAILEREEFEEKLDSTFQIMRQDYKTKIKSCPVR